MRTASLLVLFAVAVASAQVESPAGVAEGAAWDALARGQLQEATTRFRDALSRDGKNPRLHLGAGLAAMGERRDAEAVDEFQAALALDPNLTDARRQLGVVQYRVGDLLAAIRSYETLTAQTPDDRGAQATLERWRREQQLQNQMHDAIGAQFTVSFDGPSEAALADEVLQSLDRAYWRIGAELGTLPSDPIRVVLYTAAQFRDITRSPSWAAGAYDGTIRVPMRGALADRRELDRVLAHEFTHALIRTLAPRNVPAWLNEGLATALETDDIGWIDKYADQTRKVPLRALHSGFGGLSGMQATVAYAASARAARRMLDEAGGFAVANLLRDLGTGEEFDAAFAHRMQRTFAEFQTELASS